MFTKSTVKCPVCPNTPLGYRAKGEACAFVCTDCQFIYSWDAKGNLGQPIKVKPHKDVKCGCGCGR